ncbi:hypothetical protein [Microbacterium sp.]|uniref:hypothetical protein n=1 Tax=Microbacterium sp. TaxID=51671 RepID=UPI0025EDCDFC|nr:hypothetical protein [Microbacterium sp.]
MEQYTARTDERYASAGATSTPHSAQCSSVTPHSILLTGEPRLGSKGAAALLV